jgi:hypothetical protein
MTQVEIFVMIQKMRLSVTIFEIQKMLDTSRIWYIQKIRSISVCGEMGFLCPTIVLMYDSMRVRFTGESPVGMGRITTFIVQNADHARIYLVVLVSKMLHTAYSINNILGKNGKKR